MTMLQTPLTDTACVTTWNQGFDWNNMSTKVQVNIVEFSVAPANRELQMAITSKDLQWTIRCGFSKEDAIPILKELLSQLEAFEG